LINIYLLQHAETMSKEQNHERPLTERGRQQIASVAQILEKMSIQVDQIRHSGKTRTQQTAAILGETLLSNGGPMAVSGLKPMGEVAPVAEQLEHESKAVMLVGHLPFMERTAGFLLTKDADRPVVRFTNAAIVCLTKAKNRCQVSWILTPQIASQSGAL
jgi:phosphohistidine phosphatase